VTTPKVFGPSDPEPDVRSGAIVAVHYGDYRLQEIWVQSGANIGNWYPLGGEFGRPKVVEDDRPYHVRMMGNERWVQPPGTIPLHPRWEDITARGPVTLLVPGDQAMYVAGWADGRNRLLEQIDGLREDEDGIDRG